MFDGLNKDYAIYLHGTKKMNGRGLSSSSMTVSIAAVNTNTYDGILG